MSGPGGPRRGHGQGWGSWLVPAGFAVLWVVAGGLWLAVFIGDRLGGAPAPGGPMGVLVDLLGGTLVWPGPGASLALGCEMLVVAGLARVGIRWWWRRQSRTRVDRAARELARGKELAAYTEAGVARSAARLRPGATPSADPAEHGVFLGYTVAPPRVALRGSWEDTILLVAGTRRGKSTSWVIPQLVEAPGPALVTSLRRDVYDATVEMRATVGTVWCFDPQGLVTDTQDWWFNPLAGIASIDGARKLKDHFVAGTRGPNATTSAYFDGEGERLLAGLILAAAFKPGASLLDVYDWLTDSSVNEPVTLLRDAGQPQVAAGVNAIRTIPADKQRAGVYGSAQSLVNCLENPEVTRWITPDTHRRLPAFDAQAFVGSRDTMYLHSKEGEGNISPLVAAVSQQIFDAALRRASRSPGARLEPPLTGILDEAANVCKIRDLPKLYSYFGGSGIALMACLQSFQQGVDVWGATGMRQLMDSATVRIYGGGVLDIELLRSFSELVGDRVEYAPADDSYYELGRVRRILDASDLAALPRERALLLASGARPVIIEPRPWMSTPYAEAIRYSLAIHDPEHTPA